MNGKKLGELIAVGFISIVAVILLGSMLILGVKLLMFLLEL